jgi:hypothetical protein
MGLAHLRDLAEVQRRGTEVWIVPLGKFTVSAVLPGSPRHAPATGR